MAREVNTVLAKIMAEQRGIPESKGEEIVKSMRSANQYQVRCLFSLAPISNVPCCLWHVLDSASFLFPFPLPSLSVRPLQALDSVDVPSSGTDGSEPPEFAMLQIVGSYTKQTNTDRNSPTGRRMVISQARVLPEYITTSSFPTLVNMAWITASYSLGACFSNYA
jgi:hypothetical protein